ncbi:Dynamin-related protein 1E [Coccomyxa sp. Obi]|nr:Dynamin-related protein 1E [Coccomyxa sp. Obi]
MEGVVQLVNRLQSAATLLGDNAASDKTLPSLWELLPSIVVIGGQSSGKSSVLEAVVGKDFLPRGTGIVTRRPLVLQLVRLEDPNAREYGEFLHNNREKMYNFEAIRDEIENETNRYLKGKGRAVAPEPIQLTVYSPNVPNLTLVDMPGLTKVPIDGQPKSIVRELEDMARSYIKGDNAIILAVTPANADLATSDALHLAREVDPTGERTIGVLTKLDIMDPGTDARDVLMGQAVRLKNGWIGIVNRGQADILSKVPMEEARKKELDFFKGSRHYSDLKNVGTGFLSSKLSTHLINAIRKQLPVIQHSINDGIINLERELEALGGPAVTTRGAMVHLILQLCRQFEEAFAKSVDGGKGGGEQILLVFEKRLTENIRKLNFDKILDPANVKRIVEEADGYQPHLIAPEMGYRRLLQECLILFKGPSDVAVEEVHAILRQIVARTLESEECKGLAQYGQLKREIATTGAAALESMKEDARKMVLTMVEMERSYLTAEVFREILQQNGRSGEGGEIMRTLSGRQMSDVMADERSSPSDKHTQKIASHVSAYIHHVRTQLKQTIPKAIVHCLVIQAKKRLLDNLHADVASSEDGKLKRMLMEDETTLKRREQCTHRLKLLKKAAEELSAASY